MTTSRVWFITGASRGLGRAFTEAALAAGDRVVGAARTIDPLADLARKHPDGLVRLPLDVSDRAAVKEGVDRAAAAFGRLDIVVNNAGGLLYGMRRHNDLLVKIVDRLERGRYEERLTALESRLWMLAGAAAAIGMGGGAGIAQILGH